MLNRKISLHPRLTFGSLALLGLILFSGCQTSNFTLPSSTSSESTSSESTSSNASEIQNFQTATIADSAADSTAADVANESHAMASSDGHRPELEMESPIELDPSRGREIGVVYEAFLSPHQEGGEEEDTPRLVPDVFKSTEPSVARNERDSHGHGVLSFTNDLSKAYIHVAIEGVKPEEIIMFHIHCGRPGQLGPIILDIALAGDLQEYWSDNLLALEVTNEDIVAAANHGEGLVAAFTSGCPIVAAIPTDKVKTIAGMELIASRGELYFNLHTKAQTYFGDIRGQLYKVEQ